MSQMNKIADVYVPLFESAQKNLNHEDVMNHLCKLTNKSYNTTIADAEKKINAQANPQAKTAEGGAQGAGVISDRKKAMQNRLKAAIGNSRL